MRLLIIEDHPEFAKYVSLLVEPAHLAFPDCVIHITNTLEDGMESARQLIPPACIILDVGLPPHSIDEVIEKWLPELLKFSPVIIVTGHNVVAMRAKVPETVLIVGKDVIRSPERGKRILFRAIYQAMLEWHTKRNDFEVMKRSIDVLEEIANANP